MNNEVGYREVRRGDIYWYRMDNGWGHETGAGRPVVIVSSDEGNSKSATLIGAFTTTQMKYGKVFVPIVYDGVESWVKCCDLITFDRAKRLGKYIGTLTDAQMAEVDQGLLRALDLDLDYGYDDEEYEEPADEEVYEEDESENLEDKIAELELELKIARAAYDKLLARVVDMKVEADIASAKPEPKKVEVVETPVVAPVVTATVVKTPAKPEPKIDVNTATETALKKIGWDSDSAKAILANRPFETLEELKSLPGVTKTLFNLVSPRMDCVRVVKEVVPVLTEKVNINTWSVDEITEALGCPKTNAGQIVAHRIKNGAFRDVNELYNVTGLSRYFVSKYIDCFTVGEPVKAAPVAEVAKVNINTMRGPEITNILGCSKTYGGYIVSYRNKNGLYKSKDELFNVPHLGKPFIMKYWDRFEL